MQYRYTPSKSSHILHGRDHHARKAVAFTGRHSLMFTDIDVKDGVAVVDRLILLMDV